MQNTEESIAKYAVDANLFRLGTGTRDNSKKNIQPLDVFWWGAMPPPHRFFIFSKMFKYLNNK